MLSLLIEIQRRDSSEFLVERFVTVGMSFDASSTDNSVVTTFVSRIRSPHIEQPSRELFLKNSIFIGYWPISEVRTYKQADNLILLHFSLRETEYVNIGAIIHPTHRTRMFYNRCGFS